MNLRRLIVATHNRSKAREMTDILQARFPELELLTLADIDGAPEPEETGTTYEQNARIKSESAAAFTGEWCVADDAGLEIDALDGAPGVYSKRFGGELLPFPEKISKILGLLADVPPELRTARYRCYIALSGPFQSTRVFCATCEGVITSEPLGQGGFGYDPIFYLPDLRCTMAELSAVRKNEISHRGKVLSDLSSFLESEFRTPSP